MSRVRRANTAPELELRRLLFGLGYRYRLHRKNLPGRPDVVFPMRRKGICVNGCFWHRHGCDRFCMSKSRVEYWGAKLERNKRRDRANHRALRRIGWGVLVVWECQ